MIRWDFLRFAHLQIALYSPIRWVEPCSTRQNRSTRYRKENRLNLDSRDERGQERIDTSPWMGRPLICHARRAVRPAGTARLGPPQRLARGLLARRTVGRRACSGGRLQSENG